MAYKRRSQSLHDSELLKAALVGYEHERAVIVEKIAEIRRQLGGRGAVTPSTNGAKPARQMSAAARSRIAEAQRKRWAAYRKAEKPAAAKKAPPVQKAAAKPMRKMSAAARKRIAEAQKKRWASYRAKKTSPKAKKAA
jgi:hypothetical protein